MGLDSFKLDVYLCLQGWQLTEKKTVAMSMLSFTIYTETIYNKYLQQVHTTRS